MKKQTEKEFAVLLAESIGIRLFAMSSKRYDPYGLEECEAACQAVANEDEIPIFVEFDAGDDMHHFCVLPKENLLHYGVEVVREAALQLYSKQNDEDEEKQAQ